MRSPRRWHDEVFALVIADPPWVRSAALARHPDDPPAAIDGGADGLAVAHECVEIIDRHLDPEGVALLQLGTARQARHLALPVGLVVDEMREYARGVVVCLRRPTTPHAGGGER